MQIDQSRGSTVTCTSWAILKSAEYPLPQHPTGAIPVTVCAAMTVWGICCFYWKSDLKDFSLSAKVRKSIRTHQLTWTLVPSYYSLWPKRCPFLPSGGPEFSKTKPKLTVYISCLQTVGHRRTRWGELGPQPSLSSCKSATLHPHFDVVSYAHADGTYHLLNVLLIPYFVPNFARPIQSYVL